VYVDGNNNKTTTYDSNDRQYVFGWNDSTVVEGGGRSATGVTFSKVDSSSTAYRIELKIPWSTLGVTASTNKLVGLDVHINDDDAGGAREGKRMWNDTTDTAWSNPSRFGTVTLTGTPGGGGGTWTLNPTADKSGQGDTGTDITPPVSQWAHYHLKFSTSAVTGTVSNAKLRVYRNETGAGSITLYASQSVGNSDSWTEGGTVPGAGTQITSVANQNSVAYVEFDVTSFVSSQVTGDDVVTLVVTTSSGTWTRVNSRENASNKPQLVITSN
jgi:oligosaccharide reducing-end xylanase